METSIDYTVLDDEPTKVKMLTTKDNPYNPFTHFDEWYMYDVTKGYNSCCLLARFAKVSDELSSTDYNDEVDRAIRRIIALDPTDTYTAIEGDDPPTYVKHKPNSLDTIEL